MAALVGVQIPGHDGGDLRQAALGLVPVEGSDHTQGARSPDPFTGRGLLVRQMHGHRQKSSLSALVPQVGPGPTSVVDVRRPLTFGHLRERPRAFEVVGEGSPVGVFPTGAVLLPPGVDRVVIGIPLVLVERVSRLPRLQLLPVAGKFLLVVRIPIVPGIFRPLDIEGCWLAEGRLWVVDADERLAGVRHRRVGHAQRCGFYRGRLVEHERVQRALLPRGPAVRLLRVREPITVSSQHLLEVVHPPRSSLLHQDHISLRSDDVAHNGLSTLGPVELAGPACLFADVVGRHRDGGTLLRGAGGLRAEQSRAYQRNRRAGGRQHSLHRLAPVLTEHRHRRGAAHARSSTFRSPRRVGRPRSRPRAKADSLP